LNCFAIVKSGINMHPFDTNAIDSLTEIMYIMQIKDTFTGEDELSSSSSPVYLNHLQKAYKNQKEEFL